MVVDVQSKLWLALGSVKDHASIGKAILYNRDGLSSLDIAVVRATAHDNNPIDDKHIHEILFLVSNSSASIPYLAERISHRLEKTRDRIVAFKTLLLVHRLLRGGNRNFEQDLRNAHLSGHLQMNTRWFPNNSHHSISFLHNYADFLEERMGWVINQAGKLEPILFQGLEFRFYEEKSIEMVFHRLPKCQAFLDKVLNCSPLEISPTDCLTQAAVRNILRESFLVYMTFCEGVATLSDSFFDFNDPARVLALDVLKKASRQSYELHYFFESCKRTFGTKNLDYPSVQIITADHVLAMEQFFNCSSQTSRKGSSPCPIYKDLKKPIGSRTNLVRDILVGAKEETTGTSSLPFTCRLETKISTVWVVFDEEETQNSRFSKVKIENHSPGKANNLPPADAKERVKESIDDMEIQHGIPYSYYNPLICVESKSCNSVRSKKLGIMH